MKRSILANRKDVVSAFICAYPGGRKYAASNLGMPLKKFDNQAYESAGSRPLTDDHIHRLERTAGTTFLPDYICSMYGGMFVPLPEPETLDNVELYQRTVKVSAKRGAVDLAIAKALDDGAIQPDEANIILSAHRRYLSARHAEVLATLRLHRKGARL